MGERAGHWRDLSTRHARHAANASNNVCALGARHAPNAVHTLTAATPLSMKPAPSVWNAHDPLNAAPVLNAVHNVHDHHAPEVSPMGNVLIFVPNALWGTAADLTEPGNPHALLIVVVLEVQVEVPAGPEGDPPPPLHGMAKIAKIVKIVDLPSPPKAQIL